MSSTIYFYRYCNELAFSSKAAQKLMTVGIVFLRWWLAIAFTGFSLTYKKIN